jgi:hypothetical protein
LPFYVDHYTFKAVRSRKKKIDGWGVGEVGSAYKILKRRTGNGREYFGDQGIDRRIL